MKLDDVSKNLLIGLLSSHYFKEEFGGCFCGDNLNGDEYSEESWAKHVVEKFDSLLKQKELSL